MDAITAFDAIVVVLLILSTLMAFARGFMRELATLGAFIAALAAAYFANKYLHPAFTRFLPQDTSPWLPSLILFLAFFLLVYVIVAWFGANLSRSIQGVEGIGLLDRITGAAFGFIRGAVILVFFVFLLRMALDQDRIPEWIRMAQSYSLLESGADYVAESAPELARSPASAQP
ncbi:CvpA family protein [Henriciella barbarensis]|uniref:CvpA family protein n=2 Tax=Henriciella barbarensis TaxID=86342 RepID=A0A399QU36_9PROT|nr:CvpA family protein [Henriciella barbarensis]